MHGTTNRLTAAELKELLSLQPHPEGGYFREIYRSSESIAASGLASRYAGYRSMSTAIFYLLTADTFSTMHRVKSDEVFHFYAGDPVEQLRLYPDGRSEVVILGTDVRAGHSMVSVVDQAVWQGARVMEGGEFALLGATVAPGFDFVDYEEGGCAELTSLFPYQSSMIAALTRKK